MFLMLGLSSLWSSCLAMFFYSCTNEIKWEVCRKQNLIISGQQRHVLMLCVNFNQYQLYVDTHTQSISGHMILGLCTRLSYCFRMLQYSVFVLRPCFSLVNCLWILNLLMYINICISLTHFLSDTHTRSVSQPTPGTDKGSFMFAGLSRGQRGLVLRASFTRSEWSWRRNEKKPYISRCCRVKEVLLVCNSFLDFFPHHYSDTPLASYLAHLLHSCLSSKKMDNSLLGAF